ncbi:MAG: nucleotidyltransferase domain-containing protein [Deltaproteobacteria bacterium]|nr:nucleotidyltransferase domain-containing protein [Deltaproteobacteria bacterium]MBI4223392.1 nucleotidyltransferase domain-containing protein [Deltaproteobacteria bacterium]
MEQVLLPSKPLKKLLTFFFQRPKERFYLRELARSLKEPASSLQRHLALLEENKILQCEKQGPLKYFSLNGQFDYLEELRAILLGQNRREALEKDLQKVLRILKARYHPEKIILFGSFGAGERIRESTDLDLCIVKKDVPERYWDRVREVASLLKGCSIGIDFVVWTPRELEEEEKQNRFLNEEILKKGRVVYAKAA